MRHHNEIYGDSILLLILAVVSPLLFIPVTANNSEIVSYYLTQPNEVIRVNLTQNIDKLDPNVITHFILHGWATNANKTSYVEMADALLKLGPSNVIRVDYSPIAKLDYVLNYIHVPVVGNIFSKFIIGLIQKHNFKPSLIHIVGHSIGAQVTGAACREVFAEINEKVGWATGLDPTMLGYELLRVPGALRLTKNDASFVGMVHTDAGGYGYKKAAGHIDFFANENGRRLQPGCIATKPTDLRGLILSVLSGKPDDGLCSHHRSNVFYIESVFTRTLATKCDSYENYRRGMCDNNEKIVFGVRAPHNTTGMFYFRTRDSSPYLIPSQ